MIEDIVHYSGNDTLLSGISYDTLHGMRFTGGRLAVREYCAVIAGQNVADDALRRFIVDFFLGRVRFEYFIEEVDFTLL